MAVFFLVIISTVRAFRLALPLALATLIIHAVLYEVRYYPYLRWPIDMFLAGWIAYAIIRYALKLKIPALRWSFKFSRAEWLSIAIINIPSIGILIWYYRFHPDVAKQWPLPDLPSWSLPFLVILIAALNGLREEFLFRGFLQNLTETIYPPWFSIMLQAVLFGALHYVGAFPQGWLGVGMTAAWGSAIAIQFHVFRSLTLAWLTHSIADAVMFTIIFLYR